MLNSITDYRPIKFKKPSMRPISKSIKAFIRSSMALKKSKISCKNPLKKSIFIFYQPGVIGVLIKPLNFYDHGLFAAIVRTANPSRSDLEKDSCRVVKVVFGRW